MDKRIEKTPVDFFGEQIVKNEPIRNKFIEPPFSILDTTSENWLRRKREWMKLGIKSELGRDVTVLPTSFASEKYGRTAKDALPKESIFDPALCELMYNWFCVGGNKILDYFAGGSVRGITANYLGFNYTGIDIRPEQIESNYQQAKSIIPDNIPNWITGDSLIELDKITEKFDMTFTCPPYADLEVYSDLVGDISNKKYPEFLQLYKGIIHKSCQKLKSGGFAVIVIGEVRDKKTGNYYGFLPDTINIFRDCGMEYYNQIVLKNAVGTAMLRANNTFERGGRKVVKTHQDILVFRKPKTFSLD